MLGDFLTEDALAAWQSLVRDSVMRMRRFEQETFQM